MLAVQIGILAEVKFPHRTEGKKCPAGFMIFPASAIMTLSGTSVALPLPAKQGAPREAHADIHAALFLLSSLQGASEAACPD